MHCFPRLFTNLHVHIVTPAMSMKAPDILGPDFADIFFGQEATGLSPVN